MQATTFLRSGVLACLLAAAALAQEGHPLAGTWHGNWGPDTATRHDLTVFMDWDGKAVTGLVNPGFDQSPLQNAKLNPKDWTVHFEIDSKDALACPDPVCKDRGSIGCLFGLQLTFWNRPIHA